MLEIEVSENHLSDTFTGLTTGLTTHVQQARRLMGPLLLPENCLHLPGRMERRQKNFARYLQLAQKL